ncbi:lactadherin-like [Strongylocentrotus purpuratus]|uniref:Uncharacterized protein n=1 Tax=Strongylocentrotus purpuratus TaxID=7668 RepID=A0A7M7P807_STRPU|nr:lactadherin-like [Strongylocentrotus purpuratus]
MPVSWLGHISLRMEIYGEGPLTDTPACQEDPTGVNYRGNLSQTINNHTCQEWTSQDPQQHDRTPANYPNAGLDDNYCRNPDDYETAWCYTTDPGKRWEVCAVGFLDPRCQATTEPTTSPTTPTPVQSETVTSQTTVATTEPTTNPTTPTHVQSETQTSQPTVGPIQDASPLGLESRAIPDSSLTASSEYDANHGPRRGRLNIAKTGALFGGWTAKTKDLNQWIQVDLLDTYSIVGVATQGRKDQFQWVSSFKIACSMNSITFDTVKDPNNTDNDNIFAGNSDKNTVVYNRFPVPMVCRYVRLLPYTWQQRISLRMELFGRRLGPFQDASPLGLESGAIPDSSLTASSEYNANHGTRRGRLNIAKVGALFGGWTSKTNDLNQWFQVDLLDTYIIVGVATQGRKDQFQWVSSFKIACSMNSITFDTVKGPNNTDNDNIFAGNSDKNTVVYNRFPVPMLCRYVRLLPYTWQQRISLRMELLGRRLGPIKDASPLGLESGEIPDSSLSASTTYIIVRVATQGREDYSQWVTSFKIACSINSITFDTVKDPTNTDNDNSTAGETTVYLETTRGGQVTTRTASTTLKTSSEGTVAVTAPTKTTPPKLQVFEVLH